MRELNPIMVLMYSFHGWFCLRESPLATDEDEHLAEIVEEVRQRIHQMHWDNNFIFAELRVMNGEYFLYLGGNTNHRGDLGDDIDSFLAWVANRAPGSYGLLYWNDLERDFPAGQNVYQVSIVTRGTITVRVDPFLSPIIPTVEDPWEPDKN